MIFLNHKICLKIAKKREQMKDIVIESSDQLG